MSMTRVTSISPLNLFFFLSLFLGVCFFYSVTNAIAAVDQHSSLFPQNQMDLTSNEKSAQPLALPEETPNPSPNVFSSLLRLVLALGLIIALIFATVWGLKVIWAKRGWNNLSEEDKPIKVLASTYLAPRRAIHLVEIGKRILVVGIGNNEMSCMDVITDPAEVEALLKVTKQGFPAVFNRLIKKETTVQHEADAQKMIKESSKVVEGYVEKLKKISRVKKEDILTTDEDE